MNENIYKNINQIIYDDISYYNCEFRGEKYQKFY